MLTWIICSGGVGSLQSYSNVYFSSRGLFFVFTCFKQGLGATGIVNTLLVCSGVCVCFFPCHWELV